MARFALYAYQRQGCRHKGEFDTLNEAKRALFEALDGDIESCETISKFGIYDGERKILQKWLSRIYRIALNPLFRMREFQIPTH